MRIPPYLDEIECRRCGVPFIAKFGQKYCCKECRIKDSIRNNRLRYNREKEKEKYRNRSPEKKAADSIKNRRMYYKRKKALEILTDPEQLKGLMKEVESGKALRSALNNGGLSVLVQGEVSEGDAQDNNQEQSEGLQGRDLRTPDGGDRG